ncbi:hypothetical protein SAMN04487906_0875 [Zhouia amylolytica]|uniref:Uncharacterized protein n=2 Tax=Zhouia amylolytica TaxID=376730 RepID=W2UNI6_9FLAO|nr:hypothetical protein [Zhouia amylolytica]ETN95730.1 hypothetical protein P278_14520 [Zhouia amylolytica AD3]SFS55986.1 hypothetical protein SAMN04487906_0875 [Zhouia amylolytica]
MFIEKLIIVCFGIIGALLTYIINTKLKQGPVRASALSALLVGGFFYLFPSVLSEHLTNNIPVVFIGGSFIGMVSSRIISNYWLITFSGIIFSFFYINTSDFFNGYGGALGTAACISILATLSIPILTKKRKVTNGILILRKLLYRKK